MSRIKTCPGHLSPVHRANVLLWQRWRAYAVKRYKANLVPRVVLIAMVLMKDQLKEQNLPVNGDSLHFSSLELGALVRVKRREAELLKLNVVQW